MRKMDEGQTREVDCRSVHAALRVFLRRGQQIVKLQPTDLEKGVRVALPLDLTPGDWQLIVAPGDGTTPPREITMIRVAKV
jgi:hypothetical protein